jgi:Fe-S cluster assembly protein SufD
MTPVSEQTGTWLAQFTAQPKAEPWVQALREAAFQRFAELGFPTTHDEEWRFTNVAPIARTPWHSFVGQALSPANLPDAARPHLAQHALYDRNAFVALNTAFLSNLTLIEVPRGAVLDQPIEIQVGQALSPANVAPAVFAAGELPIAIHPRTLILVGSNAQCSIVETYAGAGAYFTNAVTEIVAGEGAVIDHYKLQQESPEAFHVSTMHATLGRSANFSSHSISLGGALVRNDANVTLSEGTEATLNGLYIVNGRQHIDNHTEIDHAKPHGTSHELYKGVLDGHATAVFNGRIIVRKDAQKTDSKQTNKNLVLSDDAVINTKPELQILADDVRCTHGATIGQLDAEALFYMQSRGIGRRQARDLLTYAFAQDIIDRVKIPALKDQVEKVLFEKFHEHAE